MDSIEENEIMYDFDIDKYVDKYCNIVNCHACDGTDQNGEPNGYGCIGNDEYVEARYQSILKRRLKKLRLTANICKG